jgi:cell division protease FtsH
LACEESKMTMSSTGRNSDSAPVGRVQPVKSGPGASKGTKLATMPPRRTWLWFVLILLVNFLLVRFLMPGAEAPVIVPYTLFRDEVGKGNVQAIHSQGDTITGRFKAPVTYPPASKKVRRRPRASPERGARVARRRKRRPSR